MIICLPDSLQAKLCRLRSQILALFVQPTLNVLRVQKLYFVVSIISKGLCSARGS